MKSRLPILLLALCLLSVDAGATVLQAQLQGSPETDPDGRGRVILNFDDEGATFTLTWRQIGQPTAAHIHRSEGSVAVDLAPSFDRSSGSGFITIAPSLKSEILQDPNSFYVNVHTDEFPGGAISGTLATMSIPENSFTSSLSSDAVLVGGDPDGTGVAIIEVDADLLYFTLQVDKIDTPTAAHIHSGNALSSGPIFVDLAASFQSGVAQGSVTIDAATRDAILANPENYYVNVHNAEFPDGAVRAQLANQWVLPVAGKVQGSNNTNYVTDLRILSRSAGNARVRIDYFELSTTGSDAPTETHFVTVPAMAQVVLNDILGNLFQRSGLGAMTFTSDRNMVIVGRVINDLRATGSGTNGLFIQAPPLDGASSSGAFPFLSNATPAEHAAGEGFRTNIGFFNPGPDPASLTVTLLRSSDGHFLGNATIDLGPFQQQQAGIFDLVNEVPVEERGVEDFFATWTSTRPIFVYVSVTDNATGDAMVID